MNSPNDCRIQADAILVSTKRLMAPGQIVVRQGRIVEVTANTQDTPDVRLNDCVLLPGLVNAHTHLEFSELSQPLPPGRHFPDWIQSVLALRQQAAQSTATQGAAITAGLIESRASGVAVVGDIVTTPWSPQTLATRLPNRIATSQLLSEHHRARIQPHLHAGLPKVIAFIEQLGLSPQRRSLLAEWRRQLLTIPQESWPERLYELAFSPHAPYSTVPELCEELSQLAELHHSLLAMHVLESPAEREWLDSGTGPFADMLANFGASGWRLPHDYVAQLCRTLSRAKSALLIHGNYLTDSELDLVARHQNLSLVYCPRTHRHFGHREYPLTAMENRGIRWSLGTDSRSTNPDLDLWQEARQALRAQPWLRPTQALGAITETPAGALCIDQDFGSLQPGRIAAINWMPLPNAVPAELETLIAMLFDSHQGPRSLCDA